ncbi:MAG: VanZ family protein [Firmicutes bacterium]|nr:VanZ family protein [Bacillota bacterium]
MIKNSWRWLIVMSIILIIFCLSDIPDLHIIREDQLPLWLKQLSNKYTVRFGTTGYFSYVLSLHPDYVLHKVGHIIAFGTLGVSIYWAAGYSATWAVALTAMAAAWDEWHQSFVPGRSSRFGDVVLDTLAAMIFILIVKTIRGNIKDKEKT